MILNELSYSGLAPPKAKWSEPALEDITGGNSDWDDISRDKKMKVKSHFLVTVGKSNPPSDFGQLALPVVGANGKLYKSALDNAAARLNQVKDLSKSDQKRVANKIDRLQKECFSEPN